MEVGEFVVRPSSQGLDKLTLTRKVCGLSASLSLSFTLSLALPPSHCIHLLHEFARYYTQRVVRFLSYMRRRIHTRCIGRVSCTQRAGRSLSLALARSLSRARSLCRLLSLSICM